MTSKIKYKMSFQDDCLIDNNFKSWISKIENDAFSARYKICNKTISIAGEDVKALESHEKSMQHKNRLPEKQSKLSYHKATQEVLFQATLLQNNLPFLVAVVSNRKLRQRLCRLWMLYSAIILLIIVQVKAIYSQPCFQIALLPQVLHMALQSVVL